MMKQIALARVTALALPAVHAGDRITGQRFATRSEVIATHGMVATAHPLATQIGLDVLKKGGSAVDAAIAANGAIGLMEPVSYGVGGDLFAIVRDAKTKKLYGYNGSGRSPKPLTLKWFQITVIRRSSGTRRATSTSARRKGARMGRRRGIEYRHNSQMS